MTLYQKDTSGFKPHSGTPPRACEDCEIPHFIRREGKDTGEAAFSAPESHFQDTLKSNRFSLGCETKFHNSSNHWTRSINDIQVLSALSDLHQRQQQKRT